MRDMPTAPKRRCGKCRAIVSGRCSCDEKRRGRHRPFARKVYNSKAFKLLRERVYERDEATCALCGEPVPWDDYHCDHKQDIARRPDLAYDEDNLQVMHAACHWRKTTGAAAG